MPWLFMLLLALFLAYRDACRDRAPIGTREPYSDEAIADLNRRIHRHPH